MADNEQLLITLGVQDKGASQQINSINKEIKALDKEFKSANSVSKDFEKSTEGLKTKLSYLEKSYTANNAKLDAYKKRMQETNEAIVKKQAELEKLNSAEEVNQKAINKANEQLEKMKNTLRTTAQNITLTENEMKRLANEINNVNNELKNESLDKYERKMQELGASISSAGEKISGIGEKANKFSLVAGIATGALSTLALSAENDLGVLEGRLGTTGEQTENLKKVALSVYSDGFGESLGSCVDDLVILQQNLESTKNWTDETRISILEQISSMNELFGTTTEELTKTLAVMQNSGLDDDIEHAMDVLTYGFQNGANYSDELLDTMREYSPQFVKFGLDSEEAMKYLITGAQNGAFNLDKVGDAMKELSIRVIDGSNTTKQGFEMIGLNADDMAKKFGQGGEVAKKALNDTLKGIANIQDPVKQSIAGVDLMGTMWEDLGAGVITSLSDVEGGLDNVNDATKRASESLQQTPAKQFEKSLRESKNELIPLGTELLKVATVALPTLTDGVKVVTKFLNGLDDSTKQNIAKIALLTTAVGPAVTTIGKMTTGVGNLVTTFGKFNPLISSAEAGVTGLSGVFSTLSTIALPLTGTIAAVGTAVYAYTQEQEAMSKSVVSSREELGLVKTALLELNGVHVQSKKELEDAGLAYKDFGNNIGDDFKNKVNESTKSINDFNYYLRTINMDDVLTDEETTGFTNRVDNMVNTAIESIKNKQSTVQAEMSKTFTLDDGKLDESEQQVLEYLNKNYNTNITEITKLKDDVNAIYKKAIDEKRELNEQEIKDIQDKTARIKQIELEALANNQQEQLFAKNEFINRVKQVDAQGAEELLIAQKETLDKQNAQTLASYDTQIETMKLAREKAEADNDIAERDNLDKQIQLKTEERDKIIEKQRETWEGCIGVVEEMNPELNGKINQYSGELLTNADLQAQKGLQYARDHYSNLDGITQEGWAKVRNNATGAMEDVYVTVDKNTGEITGCWNKTTGVVGGYTDEMKQKVKELGEQHESERVSIEAALSGLQGSTVNAKNEMVNAWGEVIGKLEDVKVAEDGTRQGIIDINGTPMEITTNSDGVITSMHEVKRSVEEIPKEKNVTISFFQQGLNAIKSAWDSITNKKVSIDENETGTYNYSGTGLSTIDESGWELASNNNVALLGSYSGNTLASIPSGTSIRTHMQSVADMKAEITKQINSLLANKSLNNSNSAEIDYNKLANVMLNTITQGLSNVNFNTYVEVDANGMVDKSVTKTLDILKRQTRSNSVSKGR